MNKQLEEEVEPLRNQVATLTRSLDGLRAKLRRQQQWNVKFKSELNAYRKHVVTDTVKYRLTYSDWFARRTDITPHMCYWGFIPNDVDYDGPNFIGPHDRWTVQAGQYGYPIAEMLPFVPKWCQDKVCVANAHWPRLAFQSGSDKDPDYLDNSTIPDNLDYGAAPAKWCAFPKLFAFNWLTRLGRAFEFLDFLLYRAGEPVGLADDS